jgi:hypothetical protein
LDATHFSIFRNARFHRAKTVVRVKLCRAMMAHHHTLQSVDTNTKMKLAVIATLVASAAAFSVSPKDLGQVRCRKSEEIASK